MFDKFWFKRHQKKLLWLLNAPLVRVWFRWVLRIHGKRSDVGGRRIAAILPNAIFWVHKKTRKRIYVSAEFRTHDKFTKRVFYAFLPLWRLLHRWDTFVANAFVPRLNLGFDTLTVYPDPHPEVTSVDGGAYRELNNSTWASIHDSAGNLATGDANAIDNCFYIVGGTNANTWLRLVRGFFLFDTSALGGSANISAATLSLYGSSKEDGLAATPNFAIVSSAPASNTAIVAADYSTRGSTDFATRISYAAFSAVAYNDFAFNASGIAAISKTGISKFACINGNYDVDNVAPPYVGGNAQSGANVFYADQAGTTQDPKLVITYAISKGGVVPALLTLNVG